MQPFQRLLSFFSSVRGFVSKNCSVPPILPFLFLLGSLAWVSQAGFAASFDCTKAGTAIEKMICADPAISKLDEDLAAAYRDALVSAPDKEALRRQHREWLTQVRDRCRDSECIKAAYDQRLAQVKAPPAKEPANAEVAKDRKYPPYPEVWGYRDSKGISSVCMAEDGDIYVIPSGYYKDIGKTKIFGFFSATTIELSPKDVESVERDGKSLPRVGHLKCAEQYNYKRSLTLSDGTNVGRVCIGGSCQQLFGVGVESRDKYNHTIARKVFLYLEERPRKMYVPRPAAEGGGFSVTGQVRQLDPYFVPLNDDTFLLFAEKLVRFDAKLDTKYPINQDRIFVVDAELIEEIYRQATDKVSHDEVAWVEFVQRLTVEELNNIAEEKRP